MVGTRGAGSIGRGAGGGAYPVRWDRSVGRVAGAAGGVVRAGVPGGRGPGPAVRPHARSRWPPGANGRAAPGGGAERCRLDTYKNNSAMHRIRFTGCSDSGLKMCLVSV